MNKFVDKICGIYIYIYIYIHTYMYINHIAQEPYCNIICKHVYFENIIVA